MRVHSTGEMISEQMTYHMDISGTTLYAFFSKQKSISYCFSNSGLHFLQLSPRVSTVTDMMCTLGITTAFLLSSQIRSVELLLFHVPNRVFRISVENN